MGVVDNLNLINQYKGDIKQAIINKGVSMNNTPLSGYANKIGQISGGGGIELDKREYLSIIFTSASNVIAIPDIKLSGDYKIEMDCRFSNSSSGYSTIFCSRTSTAGNNNNMLLINHGNENKITSYYNSSASATNYVNDGSRMTIVRDKNKLYVNGELILTHSTSQDFTPDYGLTLFGSYTNYGIETTNNFANFSAGTIYSLKLYKDDVLVNNFVPVVFGGIKGLYDTIGNIFAIPIAKSYYVQRSVLMGSKVN